MPNKTLKLEVGLNLNELRMKNLIISTLILLFINVFSQTKATTEKGEKVILNDNGTWVIDTTKKEIPKIVFSKENCNYSKNEVDEFSGKEIVAMKDEKFIGFTSEDLKKYYRNKDYITCKVYCMRVNKLIGIHFYWKISTKEAYKYFGSIQKGSKLILKFKNGETLELNYVKSDSGDMNYDDNYTTYSNYVKTDEEIIKTLKENEIEKVRMYWSKGYEDYPVTDGQLLMRQLPCVE